MNIPLLLSNLSELVGKTISWESAGTNPNSVIKMKYPQLRMDLSSLDGEITIEEESRKAVYGCRGITKITDVDITLHNPIISTEDFGESNDNLCLAFVDEHSMLIIDGCYRLEEANGKNNCLSYGSVFNTVFYKIVSDN